MPSTPGHKLLVFHQTSGGFFALSRGREVGLGACQLAAGILLVTFNRSTLPAVAVAEVERACHPLRF